MGWLKRLGDDEVSFTALSLPAVASTVVKCARRCDRAHHSTDLGRFKTVAQPFGQAANPGISAAYC